MLPPNYPKVPDVNQLWYSSFSKSFITAKRIDDLNQVIFSNEVRITSNSLATALQQSRGVYKYGATSYHIFTGLYVEYKGPFSFTYLTDKQGISLDYQSIVFSDSELNLWLATSFDKDKRMITYRKCNGKGRTVQYLIDSTFTKKLHYIGHLITPPYDIFHELFCVDYRIEPDSSTNNTKPEQWFPIMNRSQKIGTGLAASNVNSLFLAKKNFGNIKADKYYILTKQVEESLCKLVPAEHFIHKKFDYRKEFSVRSTTDISVDLNMLYLGLTLKSVKLDFNILLKHKECMVFIDENNKIQLAAYDCDRKKVVTTPLTYYENYTKEITDWKTPNNMYWTFLGAISGELYEQGYDSNYRPNYITETNDTKIKEETKMNDRGIPSFHPKEKIVSLEFNEASPEMIALRAEELAQLLGYKEKVDETGVYFFKPKKMSGMFKVTPEQLQALFTKEIIEKRNAKVFEFAIDNDYVRASSTAFYPTDKAD